MARKILFVTTDQQRYDSLGCNGGTIARTPVVDGLAARGVRYERAYNQNTVCMPALFHDADGSIRAHARGDRQRCSVAGGRPVDCRVLARRRRLPHGAAR